MKYGIYYAYWEKQWGADYRKYVEKVSALGFDILEISCAGLKNMKEDEIKALKEAAEKHSITLTGGYGPRKEENIASEDEKTVQNTFAFWRETFGVMEKLEIKKVGGGLYSYWPVDYRLPIDKAKDLQQSIKQMKKLADLASDYGITLCMEVLNRHEGYLLNTAREGADYVDAVGKANVKLMLDTYHMAFEEDSFEEAIEIAGNRLEHLHIGENNRKVPGQGKLIPWEKIAGALKKIGYNGDVVMEPFVIPGGEVGADIRVWRELISDTSEVSLDKDAKESLRFIKNIMEG